MPKPESAKEYDTHKILLDITINHESLNHGQKISASSMFQPISVKSAGAVEYANCISAEE